MRVHTAGNRIVCLLYVAGCTRCKGDCTVWSSAKTHSQPACGICLESRSDKADVGVFCGQGVVHVQLMLIVICVSPAVMLRLDILTACFLFLSFRGLPMCMSIAVQCMGLRADSGFIHVRAGSTESTRPDGTGAWGRKSHKSYKSLKSCPKVPHDAQ